MQTRITFAPSRQEKKDPNVQTLQWSGIKSDLEPWMPISFSPLHMKVKHSFSLSDIFLGPKIKFRIRFYEETAG